MITRANLISASLLGALTSWSTFTATQINHAIQLTTFRRIQVGDCIQGLWHGDIRLAGTYTNEDYLTITRTITHRLAHILDPNTPTLYAPDNTSIYLTYLVTSATLIYMNIWSTVLPAYILSPALADINVLVVEADTYHRYDANGMLIIWGQIISLAILTIWARGVGPRFRPDQISDLTWKDLLVFLLGVLVLAAAFMH